MYDGDRSCVDYSDERCRYDLKHIECDGDDQGGGVHGSSSLLRAWMLSGYDADNATNDNTMTAPVAVQQPVSSLPHLNQDYEPPLLQHPVGMSFVDVNHERFLLQQLPDPLYLLNDSYHEDKEDSTNLNNNDASRLCAFDDDAAIAACDVSTRGSMDSGHDVMRNLHHRLDDYSRNGSGGALEFKRRNSNNCDVYSAVVGQMQGGQGNDLFNFNNFIGDINQDTGEIGFGVNDNTYDDLYSANEEYRDDMMDGSTTKATGVDGTFNYYDIVCGDNDRAQHNYTLDEGLHRSGSCVYSNDNTIKPCMGNDFMGLSGVDAYDYHHRGTQNETNSVHHHRSKQRSYDFADQYQQPKPLQTNYYAKGTNSFFGSSAGILNNNIPSFSSTEGAGTQQHVDHRWQPEVMSQRRSWKHYSSSGRPTGNGDEKYNASLANTQFQQNCSANFPSSDCFVEKNRSNGKNGEGASPSSWSRSLGAAGYSVMGGVNVSERLKAISNLQMQEKVGIAATGLNTTHFNNYPAQLPRGSVGGDVGGGGMTSCDQQKTLQWSSLSRHKAVVADDLRKVQAREIGATGAWTKLSTCKTSVRKRSIPAKSKFISSHQQPWKNYQVAANTTEGVGQSSVAVNNRNNNETAAPDVFLPRKRARIGIADSCGDVQTSLVFKPFTQSS
eukprot:Lankesteria_metandrocarpae@DN8230_c0_g1_i1.p1